MSSITSKGLLVGIYTDWPIDLNLSTLLKDWYNLANFYFKKKKNRWVLIVETSEAMSRVWLISRPLHKFFW